MNKPTLNLYNKFANLKEKFIENRIVIIAIIIFLIYWILESIMDTFLFQSNKNFIENLFFLEIHESWHRFLIFGFFIFIGLYSQNIITRRKKAELKIIELARYTSENPNPILRISKNQIAYINEVGQELFNLSENSETPNFLREKITDSMSKEKRELVEVKFKDRFYSFVISPNKEADYTNIYGMDITERKKAEDLILEEYQKLSELNQMRKDLIIRVSHELKTPLNAIYGASQRLFEYHENHPHSHLNKYVEIINRGGNRLKNLISNIIDASKIDYNKMELKMKKENLVELIKECIEDLIFFANERKVFLNINLPQELFIKIDKFRIEQVFTNILSNAIKNTPSGGLIYIRLLEMDKSFDISIKDTGIGLTNEEMKKLFKRFGKIERYGRSLGVDIEGSGLGLYISNEIVKLHNGEILVKSEGRNKGAEFTIRLYKNHSSNN
ncbi:MAG: sensor histidine kinase [Promethearchaeota archaeon]